MFMKAYGLFERDRMLFMCVWRYVLPAAGAVRYDSLPAEYIESTVAD